MSEPVELDQERQSRRARRGNGNGNGDGICERLARLEEQVLGIKEHMAVKNDITQLKVWILGGVLSSIGIGAAIATVVVKAFF